MRLRNMLKICLVFWESEPQYAHKRYAYKKIHVFKLNLLMQMNFTRFEQYQMQIEFTLFDLSNTKCGRSTDDRIIKIIVSEVSDGH